MGSDIHMIAQVNKNEEWQYIECDLNQNSEYDSFSVMANVRNGYGFAGYPTGCEWNYLEIRGLPKNLNYNPNEDDYWLGEHSFNWALLSEMEEFANEYIVGKFHTKTGIVNIEEFKKMKKEKRTTPNSYCSSTWGPAIKVITQKQAEDGVKGTHVDITWKESNERLCYMFMDNIKILKKLAKKEKVSHDKIRLVFGFDS
ncbi:MAG: hypothetical protein PHF86_09600 [Candidatus Nanoarchaeia archaeon]|nr:hypothetical protein [Candidatus Nanoarchaeia archaeon]